MAPLQGQGTLPHIPGRKAGLGTAPPWGNFPNRAPLTLPGTTAHVGIALYGVDNKSGHRHLDGENAFHRNSLDVFQIATERNLGSIWRIRIWHDNKGGTGAGVGAEAAVGHQGFTRGVSAPKHISLSLHP